MGHADDLSVIREPPEPFPDRLRHGAADPRIYFVENPNVNAVLGFQRARESQHDP